MPRINLTSVLVDDQEKALRFYTEALRDDGTRRSGGPGRHQPNGHDRQSVEKGGDDRQNPSLLTSGRTPEVAVADVGWN